MKTIIIIKKDFHQNCWTVTFDDVEALKLCGTSTLPTPFTLQIGDREVRRRIEALNPGCIVAVSEGDKSSPLKAFLNFEKLGR